MSDAKAAFKSLVHSTHLYGRRLVVEFASGDSSLEEMRSKTRKQWESGFLPTPLIGTLKPPLSCISVSHDRNFSGGGGGKKSKQMKIETEGAAMMEDE